MIRLLLVIDDGEARAYLPSVPGQHFPVEIEPDVLERIRALAEDTLAWEIVGGNDGMVLQEVWDGNGAARGQAGCSLSEGRMVGRSTEKRLERRESNV